MLFYYGKTFESARPGARLVPVECGNCGCKYYYELARIGTGASTASYGIGLSRAERKAAEASEGDVQRRLEVEAELVPCPDCNWINDDLIEGYRQSRYRRLSTVAAALGFAGVVLSLVFAWFVSMGPPADRRLLPYFLYGGAALFACLPLVMLLLRRYLRGRIQPNRDFPSPPELPTGSPPALLLDKASGELRLAKPMHQSADEGGRLLDLQFGRHELPAVCCQCLNAASDTAGHVVHVTRLLHLQLPMCEDCFDSCNRKFQRTLSLVLMIGLVLELGVAVFLWLQSVSWWYILLSALVVLGVSLGFGASIGSALAAPAKVVARDRSRGVVRLRFPDEAYVRRLVELANATLESDAISSRDH